jgi:hypothetical protein
MLHQDYRDKSSLFNAEGVEIAEAWAAPITVTLDGVTIPVIGRRELLANKRASGRPQDLVDVDRLTKGGELP